MGDVSSLAFRLTICVPLNQITSRLAHELGYSFPAPLQKHERTYTNLLFGHDTGIR